MREIQLLLLRALLNENGLRFVFIADYPQPKASSLIR